MRTSIGDIIHGSPVDKENVDRIRDLILHEDSDVKNKLLKFFILPILSSSIAT